MDIVDKDTRRRMMGNIGGKDTKAEVSVRKYLHALGFRFRLHRKDLPGKPDIVLPKYRAAIFVHGCFWHRHLGCRYATTPKSNRDFWIKKFQDNLERDSRNETRLVDAGWTVHIIWECQIDEDNLATLSSKLRG